eukprot:CAMPEP_0113649798 /NCGR_PEP_ID=MMETSP0017_2-20120614/26478_1 /TAXON_ID=2856 /ORGANISM="Cylindrotheca closterium" /LENGTH=457 /DNA_ID=CAMNT_0000562229 /DNA_START=94 /DNA_END=1467 /DNA_ORIENTATION=- /assembly_acc=CAM_ASM_000147
MPSTHFSSIFPKKYAPMPDGGKKKKHRFFPTFNKKKTKSHEVLIETVNEDTSTVALSHLSSNPPSPARNSDSIEDPPLWTSTFDEDEDMTNASSDLLLIFTSASDDTDDPPLHVLAGQPLSVGSLSDNGSIFRTPPRKTIMPESLAPKAVHKPTSHAPKREHHKPTEHKPTTPKDYTSLPIDLDTYDEWHNDESVWVDFVDERKVDHAQWEWSADFTDWGHAPMDELAELPSLSTNNSFEEYAPKDTSDEASLDPSTVSTPLSPMIVHETPTGEVEVCDPECPLRFFPNGNEDANEETPENTPGYPFIGDDADEPVQRPSISNRQKTSPQQKQQKQDLFSLSYYQNQIAKFTPSESREEMTKRLHNDTLALIGSVSEKLYTWDEEARSRFRSDKTQEEQEQQQDDEDEVSIATSASIETRKKGNTSYFSTDAFDYPSNMFDGCNFIEPFIRYGQTEV